MMTNCIIKNNQMPTHNKADENFSGLRSSFFFLKPILKSAEYFLFFTK